LVMLQLPDKATVHVNTQKLTGQPVSATVSAVAQSS